MENIISEINSGNMEEFLLESIRNINSDPRLMNVIHNALGVIRNRFDVDMAGAILLDLHDYCPILYALTKNDPTCTNSYPICKTDRVADWGIGSRKPILSNAVDPESDFAKAFKGYTNTAPTKFIGVPLSAGGEFLGILVAVNKTSGENFKDDELTLLSILGEQIGLTLRNAWYLEEAIRGSKEAKSLYEVGIALSSTLELDELLEKILDNIRRVVHFDIAAISLVNPADGTINQIVTRGVQENLQNDINVKIGQGITGKVAQTGKGLIVSDVSADPNYLVFRPETKSEMAVPILANDAVIGVFNLESDLIDAYHDHHLELMNAFASLAGISIERARLFRDSIATRRLENELNIARRIQMTFLPASDPVINGYDIAGVNIPSTEVGGDYYDFIPIVDNQLGVAIGDVSGKGIPASLIMAAFRASLKAEIRNNFAIRAILFKVNNLLFESIGRDSYVTAIYGVLDTKNHIFTFSNAGHNPPILRRANGRVEYLEEGGTVLGSFANSNYEERPVSISKGDILLFYTDGVSEIMNDQNEEFSVERILATLERSKSLPSKIIIENIINDSKKFASDHSDLDDLTLIVIKSL